LRALAVDFIDPAGIRHGKEIGVGAAPPYLSVSCGSNPDMKTTVDPRRLNG